MDAKIWSETFRPRYYEVGPDGRIRLQALCDYFQEAANNHATELGAGMEALMDKGQSWVLARLLIQMERFPGWHDEVTVETWPAGIERMFALRLFRFRCGEEIVGFGSSAWMLFHLGRRRPMRPDFVRDFAVQGPDLGLDPLMPGRVEPPGGCQWECIFTVRSSDIDMNQHVNNISYLDWLLEALPPDLHSLHRLRRLHIEYLAECRQDEQVTSKCAREEGSQNGSYRHGIYRADGSAAATAVSLWKAV